MQGCSWPSVVLVAIWTIMIMSYQYSVLLNSAMQTLRENTGTCHLLSYSTYENGRAAVAWVTFNDSLEVIPAVGTVQKGCVLMTGSSQTFYAVFGDASYQLLCDRRETAITTFIVFTLCFFVGIAYVSGVHEAKFYE